MRNRKYGAGGRSETANTTDLRKDPIRGARLQSTPQRGKFAVVNGFDVYKTYIALKLHFTKPTYDFFKFNGKTSVKSSSFMNRKDRHFFDKLAKNHPKDCVGFLVANFVERNDVWVGEVLDSDAEDVFTAWKRRFQSLGNVYSDDCSRIFNEADLNHMSFDDIFKFRDGRHPLIMRLLLQRTITIETFILMNKLLSFFDLFDKEMGDDIMWNELRFKCEKYAPFLPKGDLAKYREITLRVARKNGLYS